MTLPIRKQRTTFNLLAGHVERLADVWIVFERIGHGAAMQHDMVWQLDFDIRSHANLSKRLASRRVELRGRQSQADAALNWKDALYRPLAVGFAADNHTTLMIPHGTGDDLAGAVLFSSVSSTSGTFHFC